MFKYKIFILIFVALFITQIFAEESLTNKPVIVSDDGTTQDTDQDVQKIIEEYKAYLATVSPKVREEIVAFRKAMAELNKKKRELYKALSAESQDYLKKEQQYKKKLPISQKTVFNISN